MPEGPDVIEIRLMPLEGENYYAYSPHNLTVTRTNGTTTTDATPRYYKGDREGNGKMTVYYPGGGRNIFTVSALQELNNQRIKLVFEDLPEEKKRSQDSPPVNIPPKN